MESTIEHIPNITTVFQHLKEKKWDTEFVISSLGFKLKTDKIYNAKELKIIKLYRFNKNENAKNPIMLYLIQATDGNVGYTIDI